MDDIQKRREQQRKAAERRRRKNGVKQWKGIAAVCEQCNKEYIRKGKNSKTCSPECSKEIARAKAREASLRRCRERGAPKFGDPVDCSNCGKTFPRDNPRAKYCPDCKVLQKKCALPQMRARTNEYRKKYHREKMKSDPVYAMNQIVRGSIRDSISRMGYTKRNRSHKILGCSWEFFKGHIEKQFTKGMGWHNRGDWHIDHITPISSAQSEQEVLELNHHTNLMPIWSEDNKTKGSKMMYLI